MEQQTILLVDDSVDDRMLAVRAMRQYDDVKLVSVSSGEEALHYLWDNQLPGLVLLDLKMPRMDGFEVLRRIRNDRNTEILPVVILSSSSMEEDRLRSYELGSNSYIRKPINLNDFNETMRQIVRYWFEVNTPPTAVL